MGKSEIAMTPLQQWGEETEDGAIYSIVLHRMRAEPTASKTCHLDVRSTPECPFIQYRTCKRRMIRAATLPRLMKWLVSASVEGDVDYIPSFLATYRAFSTPAQVLELLLPLGPDKEMLHVLELWLQHHPEDFWEPPKHPNLQKTLDFLKQSAPDSAAYALAEALWKGQQEKEKEYTRHDTGTDGESPGMQLSQLTREPTGREDCKEAARSLLSFSVDEVAEQLTLMDAELFRAVQPFHCLGCVWSQRDKKENQHVAPSVRATVEQFNAVTSCVITSVLADLTLRTPQRAHLLEKWINVAQRCRALRNFSSLHAILSALQSNSIYRLKRTWAAVNRDSRSAFRKLSQIFSEDNNYLNCREILLQGGGTQGSYDGCSSSPTSIASSLKLKPEIKLMAPTIPYLGTFLTDLIMLDTALPDFVQGNLINFEKRRKEAAILSWIRQLQESCQGYNLCPNSSFYLAFHQHPQFSEEQSYRISRMIESPADSCPNSPKLHRTLTKRFSSLLLGSDTPVIPSGPEKSQISPLDSHSNLMSENGLSVSASSNPGSPIGKNPPVSPLSTCPLLESPLSSPLSKQRGTESCIIRVSMDSMHGNGNLYRSIVITSQDKATAVVQRALQKHNMEEASPHNYQLLQLLRDGQELLIPDGANVFYAMNPTSPQDFLLCHKEAAHNTPTIGAMYPGGKGNLCSSPPQKDCVTSALTASLPSSSAMLLASPPALPPQLRPDSYLLTPPAPSAWLLETQQADGFSPSPSAVLPLSHPLTLESSHSALSFSLQKLQSPP